VGIELRLSYRILTPLYLGGADQRADLRPPSLKGLLRFWYRAADPRFAEAPAPRRPTHEQRLFGSAAEHGGQSPFLLRSDGAQGLERWRWKDARPQRFKEGQGKHSRNGLVYLGFPFQMHGNEGRDALAPAQSFTLRCLVPRPPRDDEDLVRLRRALTAAAWLLGHLGGAGSRARRGFGALALAGWEATGPSGGDTAVDPWPELNALPLLHSAIRPEHWLRDLDGALAVIRGWFGAYGERAHHPHLGPALRRFLEPRAFPEGEWDAALAHQGRRLQDFRQRAAPDYEMVRQDVLGTRQLTVTPPRATFGLPLAFRYTSVRGRGLVLAPHDPVHHSTLERQGSLLFLRPALVGKQLYPLYLRLDGDVPGIDPPAAVRGARRPLRPASDNAMDRLFDHLAREESSRG
jgi:CRISPR-associated protein Cmr1